MHFEWERFSDERDSTVHPVVIYTSIFPIFYRYKFSKHSGKEREGAIGRDTDALQSQVTDGHKRASPI
jgi:hypothetical protein